MDPVFLHNTFPLDDETCFLIYLVKIWFFWKKLGVTPYKVAYSWNNFKRTICGPRIFAQCVPTRWWNLLFNLFSEKLIFLKKNLELPLIFVLFLKGKQNKKENFKCDSLFGKDGLWKTWVWGLGYLLGRYGEDRSIPLSPWKWISTK